MGLGCRLRLGCSVLAGVSERRGGLGWGPGAVRTHVSAVVVGEHLRVIGLGWGLRPASTGRVLGERGCLLVASTRCSVLRLRRDLAVSAGVSGAASTRRAALSGARGTRLKGF